MTAMKIVPDCDTSSASVADMTDGIERSNFAHDP